MQRGGGNSVGQMALQSFARYLPCNPLAVEVDLRPLVAQIIATDDEKQLKSFDLITYCNTHAISILLAYFVHTPLPDVTAQVRKITQSLHIFGLTSFSLESLCLQRHLSCSKHRREKESKSVARTGPMAPVYAKWEEKASAGLQATSVTRRLNSLIMKLEVFKRYGLLENPEKQHPTNQQPGSPKAAWPSPASREEDTHSLSME